MIRIVYHSRGHEYGDLGLEERDPIYVSVTLDF